MTDADAIRVRAFFAIEPTEVLRGALERQVSSLRGAGVADWVRFVDRAALHVTVRFLGDLPTAVIPRLGAAVRDRTSTLAPFGVDLGGIGLFPPGRRPRVLVVRLARSAQLVELAKAVERAVVAAGLPRERRPFRGHLTLGRIRSGVVPRPLPPLPTEHHVLDVCEVTLMRSHLERRGARYQVLDRFGLAALAD